MGSFSLYLFPCALLLNVATLKLATANTSLGDLCVLRLYGVILVQTFTYYSTYPRDSMRLKVLVSHSSFKPLSSSIHNDSQGM